MTEENKVEETMAEEIEAAAADAPASPVQAEAGEAATPELAETAEVEDAGETAEANGKSVRGRRQMLQGLVVGDKMDKTIIVSVTSTVMHPLYQRYIKRSAKFYAHDEANECQLGDEVLIVATRPLSKTKRWRLREILKRGE